MGRRTYHTFNYPGALPGSQTLLTGIRKDPCGYVITGFYHFPADSQPTISFVYEGKLDGKGCFWPLDYPDRPSETVRETNLYGPDVLHCGKSYNIVGNYFIEEDEGALGCLYQGQLDGTGFWTQIVPTPLSDDPILNTICHSTDGGLIVGNYDTTLLTGRAFLYIIDTQQYINIALPDILSITAYGIVETQQYQYTICGGLVREVDHEEGYLVDFDLRTKSFTNWRFFSYANDPVTNLVTHFDGIDYHKGLFYLTGVYVGIEGAQAFAAYVDQCNVARWETLTYPGSATTTGNSVARDVIIGVYTKTDEVDTVNGYWTRKC